MRINSLVLVLVCSIQVLASTPPRLSYTIQTVAGSNAVGDGGRASAAALSDTEGVAFDSAGNLFIADANDHRIRKMAPDGTITTLAGDGTPGFRGDGGPASDARLNTPYGIAVDGAGDLYIADLGNNRVRKITSGGIISTVAGTDTFLGPRNVALDAVGNLYVSEFSGQRIRKVAPDGSITTLAGDGHVGFAGEGGAAFQAELSFPAGITVDAAGNLYFADSSNHRVRRISGGAITTVLGTGIPGADLPSQLDTPTGVALDTAGNLYVADSGNHRVQVLSPSGAVTTLPVSGRDITFDATGNLYLAAGAQILEMTPAGAVSPVAGDGSYTFRGDGGPATSARLNAPVAIAVGTDSALYIADRNNHRVRKVDAGGTISTLVGDGTAGNATGELNSPAGVALDGSGTLYLSDRNNDRVLTLGADGTATVVVGTGVPGFNGDGLPGISTQLLSPGPLFVAPNGTLYIGDNGNHRVRRLGQGGVMSTVMLSAASGVTTDAGGNLFISDPVNHQVVRLRAQGPRIVIAGTGTAGFSGDEGPAAEAQLNAPAGLAFDAGGNLFIADSGNHRVRMISTDGMMHTVAGTGTADFGGDDGPALEAPLNAPAGLASDAYGNIWIADSGNNRIRKLSAVTVPDPQTEPPALTVINAASMLAGPVAPGEIVSIFGVGIGPHDPQGAILNSSGILADEVADTQVFFDGRAAALFYVQGSQINAQVPYEISGKNVVEVEVFYQGASRGKTTVPVAASRPGVFTVLAGTGQVVALNEGGALNSSASPAARGSVVTLYATGEGQTEAPGIDGKPAAAPFPKPALPVVLYVGGYAAEILFAGEAPGYAGLLQINARLPGGFAPTGEVPVVLVVGTASSQAGVTISVR